MDAEADVFCVFNQLTSALVDCYNFNMNNNLKDASGAASTFTVRYTVLRIARKSQTNAQFAASGAKPIRNR